MSALRIRTCLAPNVASTLQIANAFADGFVTDPALPPSTTPPERPLRVPLDRQRELYRRHAERAVDELLRVLAARRSELIELGHERAFEQVGVEQYGDSTYFRTADELDSEAAAELADAIFYLQVGISRREGELPAPE